MMINTYQLKPNLFPMCIYMLNLNLQGNSVTGIRYSFVGEHWNYGQGCIIRSFIMSIAFVPGFCLGIVYKHSLCEKEFINNYH